MKEAAIKAHSCRHQLSTRQVSILRCWPKPRILIDPPSATITMDARVASLRGLRNLRLSRIGRTEPKASESLTGDLSDDTLVGSKTIYQRNALVKEEDRQVAEGSISHDGDFAVATCMALNETRDHSDKSISTIVDDGSGDPIHDPFWGDEGFPGAESLEDFKEAALLFNATKGPSARSVLFSGTKTTKRPEDKTADKSPGRWDDH